MDITSLIITFVGILIILAIYIISRLSRAKLPQEKNNKLPVIKNEDGSAFSSVLDDIPATDGSTPKVQEKVHKKLKENIEDIITEEKPNTSEAKKQHILFISANNDDGLDGNLVKKVLIKNGLRFGDLDIFHYLIETKKGTDQSSLFRVANGVEPWTLKDDDLHNKNVAGLSIVLDTPCSIDSKDAIKVFVAVSLKISLELAGVLKNKQQQIFSPNDEKKLIDSI